ncbi:hypothetical protein QFZ34_002037 [Phyllobacterium ifriqiyense]|uniref:Uncharacterized protein n=1 Tax=Phyllobacterium ifriqiyense TaxID=314238 RepID=A0ABU0S7Z5_9HYPH|nr:hypothetical protein [Phyllobacterium ifriqiyense]MDQ0996855.1 hypothetical protein [Phyllobacterium ifriqiyense]
MTALLALIPGPIKTALIWALAAFVLVSGSYVYGKREGRQQAAVEQLQSDVKAERDRNKSDAKLQALSDFDLCVQSLRSRGMPVDACEQLRGLPKSEP